MSKHREDPEARYRHRERVRPRYGRIAMLAVSLGVTVIAVLGGAGVLGTASQTGAADLSRAADRAIDPMSSPMAASDQASPGASTPTGSTVEVDDRTESSATADPSPTSTPTAGSAALPSESGAGRRIVFDQSDQRVWLVADGNKVIRTYLVSGSMHDNLKPGSYEVYSRSEHAIGIDDSGTMKWMVRFATGKRAPIGFHDIPIDEGARVQTQAQLGTALSHGCIRQKTSDAKSLWDFAPLGTRVVVTA